MFEQFSYLYIYIYCACWSPVCTGDLIRSECCKCEKKKNGPGPYFCCSLFDILKATNQKIHNILRYRQLVQQTIYDADSSTKWHSTKRKYKLQKRPTPVWGSSTAISCAAIKMLKVYVIITHLHISRYWSSSSRLSFAMRCCWTQQLSLCYIRSKSGL